MINIKINHIASHIRRLLIFLYGVSICYGTFAISGGSRNFTLSFILAILYMISIVPLMGKLFNVLYRYRKYIIPPVIFFILLCIMNWFNTNQYDVPIISISILSCIILFIFMLVHSYYDSKAVSYCMYGYMLGAIILSILFVLGIGIHIDMGMQVVDEERLTMFGQNQNELGVIMVNGLTMVLMSVIFYNKFKMGVLKYLFIIPIITMLTLMFGSASRAAFVALALILICVVLLHRTKYRYTQFLFLIAGFVGLWYAYQYLINSDTLMYARILQTIEDGNTSGRAEIWNAILPSLLESPILGVGQTGYALVAHQELMGIAGAMHEYGYSPHNVLIEVFAYTGIVGLVFMLIFWFRLGCDSIVCYRKANNLIPLLLLIPVAVFIMTGQILSNKFAWVLYAYIAVQGYNIKHHQQ